MYHYTESGLLNVVLQNGYEEIDTPYGKAVHIDNVDALHQAIAQMLIKQPFLSGREFRFLRVLMDMTQQDVGEYLGVSAQAVAIWEKKSRIARKEDQMIRAIYQNVPARQIRAVLDDVSPERFVQHFHLTRDNWQSRVAC